MGIWRNLLRNVYCIKSMHIASGYPILDPFLKSLDPRHLLTGTFISIIGILVVVAMIYTHVFRKKKLFIYTSRIQKHLEVWISHFILEESVDTIEIPAKFYRILQNCQARQAVIDELIRCKKNFSGAVADNIVQLYEKLGLKKDAETKLLCVRRWYIKARGIQELYLMDQRDFLTKIYRNTNDRNEMVRMEAQTGVIYMTGFPGLRFLDVISYPLTEWQQLKLLEQLKLTKKKEDLSERIPRWLLSKNDTVVVFALKLAEEYQQFAVRDAISPCFEHPNRLVREQAVKALIQLGDAQTPALLVNCFSGKTVVEQGIILDALSGMATDEQEAFLVSQLDAPDNGLKLKAATALISCCTHGWEILEKRSVREPEPFARILNHLKTMK